MRSLAAAALAAATLGACNGRSDDTAQVTVYGIHGLPESGTPVAFTDPYGTLQTTVMTDDDGRASGPMSDGGQVTTAITGIILTVLDVGPGDDLVLGVPDPGLPAAIGTLTVTGPSVAGAAFYAAFAPCASASGDVPTFTLTRLAGCADAPEIIFVAFDASSTRIAYGIAPAPALTTVGDATITIEEVAPPVPFTVSYLNAIPAGASMVSTSYWPDLNDDDELPAVGLGTFTLGGAVELGTSGTLLSTIEGASGTGARQASWTRLDPDVTFAPVDLDTTLLPWLTAPTLDDVLIGLGSPNPTVPGAIAERDIYYPEVADGSVITWRIVGPDFGYVLLPDPNDVFAFPEIDQSQVTVAESLYTADADGPSEWLEVREHAFPIVAAIQARVLVPSRWSGAQSP